MTVIVSGAPRPALDPERHAEVGPKEPAQRHGYAQILKSTALIGGSSVVGIAFGIVRTKAMAMLLGPSGVGLMGLYSSVADVARTLAGMGVQSSGVRQIAAAVGSGDEENIARTALVLRRVSYLLGVIGAALLVLFAVPVSRLTFGHSQEAAAIALLGAAVFFQVVSAGQGALIQGVMRISDLAQVSIWGAVFGTAINIPMVYLFRERGVVPALVAVAAASLATSWWYSRRVPIADVRVSSSEVRREATALLKLGFAFMASGFFTMGAAYAIRIIVLRKTGIEAAGLYQAAWALGGLYVGFILQAMGADFFPRLAAVADDNEECNRRVNQQAQISLLLAGPGVIATLAVAPLVLAIFYSPQFQGAVGLLRWICLGMTLRVVAWPMGFIIVAKGAQLLMLGVETAATMVHVGLAWALVSRFGLAGAGIAFFGLYVWHGCLVYGIVRRLSGFRWSPANLRLGVLFLPCTGAVFCACYLLPPLTASIVGMITALVTGVYSARTVMALLPPESVPGWLRPWFQRLRPTSLEPRVDRLAPSAVGQTD